MAMKSESKKSLSERAGLSNSLSPQGNKSKKICSLGRIFLLSFFLFGIWSASAFANVIRNPSFEEEIDGASNWDKTNGADRIDVAAVLTNPFPDGSWALKLDSAASDDFTFEVRDGVKEGDLIVFTARAESNIPVGGGAQGGLMCVEYKKANEFGTDQLVTSTCSDYITTANAPEGGGTAFPRFTVRTTVPPNADRLVFVLKTRGNVGGGSYVVFDDVSADINPAAMSVVSSKTHVKPGEVVTFFMQFQNKVGVAFNGVEILSELPPGFDLVQNSVRLNDQTVGWREGSLIIPVGTVQASERVTAAFQLVATRGVTIGKSYEVILRIRDASGNLSEETHMRLVVEGDPVFDEGTIVGKVFNDTNKNGKQDNGEKGVPGVRLATEEGVVIFTDNNGMYHIPAVKPGRHVVKIDGHSLPDCTQYITEESLLVKTTPGIMNKASFAVFIPDSAMPKEFGDELQVMVTQGLDTSHPVLGVNINSSIIRLGVGKLAHDAVFHFTTNYADFAKQWYLEIRDEMGREIWTGFGVSAPPSEVVWSGQMENGLVIPEGLYSYQLKMEDKDGLQDWSPLYFFRVIPANASKLEEKREIEIPPVGDFNLFKDGKKSIPLVAKPTVRIQGNTKPGYTVMVNTYPVPVDSTGHFSTEIYTSPGERDIRVVATSPAGESIAYQNKVKVKDSTFFMAGLSEGQGGVNFQDGSLDAAGKDESLKKELYTDGRLAYYLKGKLKGKFLIKSHYDTADKRSALFTNLDPDSYYPVYGDNSTREYDADSEQRFYVLVEMDRSFAKWGSFKTAFTDTELATYNRTLSGAKLHFETKSATKYGDPKRGVTAFSAKSEHRADHNEFVSTGGSLYYLRNRLVIEGSEKIRVETRDKIQGMPLSSVDLTEGTDYEIDYEQGRIILNRSINSYAQSDVLLNNDIVSGNEIFLIVDYEYDPGFNSYDPDNRGIRGYTHLGQHIRVGATAVEEKRSNEDYDLRGVDAQMKFGRNTKVTAEYAESHLQQQEQAVSYNGGMTFGNVSILKTPRTEDRPAGYMFRGETKPVKPLELSGYLQGIEPGFSDNQMMSQEGNKKYGISTKFKATEHAYLRYRYDYTEVSDLLSPLDEFNLTANYNKKRNHTIDAVYDGEKILAQAEYGNQHSELPETRSILPSFYSSVPYENVISGKLGYHLNERLLPYLKAQSTFQGDKPNHQLGGGVRYQLMNGVYSYIEQLFGTVGDSTLFGFEKYHDNGLRDYTNLRMWDYGSGIQGLTSTLGSSYSLSPKSRIYAEREHSSYQSSDSMADVFGNQTTLTDHWDFEGKFERRNLKGSTFRLLDNVAEAGLDKPNTINTASTGLVYNNHKDLKAKIFLEGRADQDTPNLRQWVSRNYLDYKLTKDLSWFSKLDYGNTRFTTLSSNAADFAEINTGFAYRPLDNDRLNILARYSYLRNLGNDLQFDPAYLGAQFDDKAHIWATDISYDLTDRLNITEKIAYKTAISDSSVTSQAIVNNLLWAHRFNYHITRKWDVALEYRMLFQTDATETVRHGPLMEIDREIFDYIRLGVGYNFTDFNDDLRKSNNYSSHGPFMRLTGKF